MTEKWYCIKKPYLNIGNDHIWWPSMDHLDGVIATPIVIKDNSLANEIPDDCHIFIVDQDAWYIPKEWVSGPYASYDEAYNNEFNTEFKLKSKQNLAKIEHENMENSIKRLFKFKGGENIKITEKPISVLLLSILFLTIVATQSYLILKIL